MSENPPNQKAGKLTAGQRAFLEALRDNGSLSTPTGNPPVMRLAKAGLFKFTHRSEDLSVMVITDLGRQALENSHDQ